VGYFGNAGGAARTVEAISISIVTVRMKVRIDFAPDPEFRESRPA